MTTGFGSLPAPSSAAAPWYLHRRTPYDRLCSALRVCDPVRWPLTYLHMAEKLVDFKAGRITEEQIFPHE